MTLYTPVVFIIFNRPDLTQIVFEEIRKVQPKQLFVIADGPRNPKEWAKCKAARKVIETVDWDCEIFRNYSDVNLGCRERVSSGLNWVFDQVEEAIVLEDDCVPALSFFSFCANLLDYYRHDERIMVISGNNFQNNIKRTKYSYYFSIYNHCWGWATWRRSWKHWSFDKKKWLEFRDEGLLEQLFENPAEAKYWRRIFDLSFIQGEPNSWDYAWTFACLSQGGLSILPNQNLVSNIGFREDATHTKDKNSKVANLATQSIGKIHHPPFVVRHKQADLYTFKTHFYGNSWISKVRRIPKKMKSILGFEKS